MHGGVYNLILVEIFNVYLSAKICIEMSAQCTLLQSDSKVAISVNEKNNLLINVKV